MRPKVSIPDPNREPGSRSAAEAAHRVDGDESAPRGASASRRAVLRVLGWVTRALVRPYRPRRQPSRLVAIVVPLSSRPDLLPEERQSMRHLLHFLGKYDKFLIAPSGARVEREGFETLHLPHKFFGSAAAHNRLLMWPRFFEFFEDYEYILIYHLDSLVLSDELADWCREPWDYIGAPWLPCEDTPWVKTPVVGNGGFTLMKVQSLLQVLYARYRQQPQSYWLDLLMRNGTRLQPLFRVLERVGRVFPRSAVIETLLQHWRISEDPAPYGRNNDYFWSFEAVKYVPAFRVADVDAGLRFAFEAAPALCFELNGGRRPFGCHAFAKFNRSFWEPYFLPDPAVADARPGAP